MHPPGIADDRPGDVALAFDPAVVAADASLVFIGRVRSPWRSRSDCPKNLREARLRGETATVELAAPFHRGLIGLVAGSHILLLSWLDRARRDLIQISPKHVEGPRGVLSLRSPVRPNPIAVDIVRLVSVDAAAGRLVIDAIDLLDGTPVLDIKPYLASVDGVLSSPSA